ncbi:MAG: DNA internalization-related competence protein ComEC/Rec2 [Proteobacteria bacterium]|nr:MAG: DNA internalization-related competence protein ComEC/Rec2 [Pseudomonadota bacterium]
MFAGTLAWLLGIVALQSLPELPSLFWISPLPLVVLLAWRCRRCRCLAIALTGFVWALVHAYWVVDRVLPLQLEGADVEVTGRVVGIPEYDAGRLRFRFDVQKLSHQGLTYPSPGQIRLSWYRDYQQLGSGEIWRVTARLKRPRGFSNPGGFDYEGWLYREGIRATGYVRSDVRNRRLNAAGPRPFSIDRLRADGIRRMQAHLEGAEFGGILSALALGDRSAISAEQWEVLRGTGISHLMAISGLHVGLVAGMMFGLVRFLWAGWPGASRWLAAPRAAGCGAILGALGYAALAGFSIPTQRALIMVAVVMGAVVMMRTLQPTRSLFLALALVVAWDPNAVLAVGFWLSFAAVGLILWVMVGERSAPALRYRWLKIQGVITLGLFPLMALAFGQVSLVAPIANLLAIPWVGFVTVPLTLLGVLALPVNATLAALLLQIAHYSLAVLWWPMEWLAELPLALLRIAEPPFWSAVLGGFGALMLLLPRGIPLRGLGLLLMVPMVVLTAHPQPSEGGFRVTLLDVGQGLAVVVRTANHTLLYDAGPRYGDHFDAGSAVVVPYLRSLGVDRLDRLVVSHGDSDHTGGVNAVRREIAVGDIRRAPNPGESLLAEHCQAAMRWEWDGIEFSVLHPASSYTDPAAENDHSCVLSVRAGDYRVLLTGDIERFAEAELLRNRSGELRADLLVVPHHGSATSSSSEFIALVRPKMAWVSAGYANRWGFPKPEIIARYRSAGAAVWTTAQYGAMEVAVDPRLGFGVPRLWRLKSQRYWSATFGGGG